jgi:hypothetical protein
MENRLQISLGEFKLALKPFAAKRLKLTEVLVAFEGGFLSFESGDVKAVMRATGNWSGRACFSPEILRAIATVPPSENPIIVSYAQNHLLLGGLTIKCKWHEGRKDDDAWVDIRAALEPSIIDVLAMERSAPRVKAAGIAKKVRSANEKMERRIKTASSQLVDLGISESEIRALVEQKIVERIRRDDTRITRQP